MKDRALLGMLTPSSNTVLEPVTSAMLGGLPEVSAHFGRFRVTKIALDDKSLGQFDERPMLDAALLLADAKVNVIAWNGTSAGWLGFDTDEQLCERIKAETGIPAITSVLALNEVLSRTGLERFGLVSPYTDDVQGRIVENYGKSGYQCVGERHLGISENFAFSEVTEGQLTGMVGEVAQEGPPQAITTFCTNLNAAPLVEQWEAALGIPVYDTISVVVWQALRVAGIDPARVKGWGQLFQQVQ